MRAYLTTLGMYLYNQTLFDNMAVPDRLDKSELVGKILLDTADMEVVLPDYNAFKDAINLWSRIKLPTWEKLIDTTELEYNPIHNYDRTEERGTEDVRNVTRDNVEKTTTSSTSMEDVDEKANTSGTEGGTSTTSENSTKNGTHTSHTTGQTDDDTSGTVEEKVSAFNQTEYAPKTLTTSDTIYHSEVSGDVQNTDKETTNGTSTLNRNLTTESDESRDITRKKQEDGVEDSTGKETVADNLVHTEKMRAYGNIGVTTTQQMIEQERKIVQFSIYEYISRQFAEAFCLLVY